MISYIKAPSKRPGSRRLLSRMLFKKKLTSEGGTKKSLAAGNSNSGDADDNFTDHERSRHSSGVLFNKDKGHREKLLSREAKEFDENMILGETQGTFDLEGGTGGDEHKNKEEEELDLRHGNELASEAYEEILLEMEKNKTMEKTNLSWILPILDLLWFPLTACAFGLNVSAWVVGIAWGVAQFRAGLVMHMGIHRAIFKSDSKNNCFGGIFVLNLLIGISWRWWRHRHSTHHRETNILTSDPDLKTYPFIVYNEQVQQTSFITQYQRKLLPLYLILYIPLWRVSSVMKCVKKGWFSDIGFTTLHWITVIAFCALSSYSFSQICVMIFLREAMTGLPLGTLFMLNHFLEDVLSSSDHDMTPLLHILKTTKNIESPNKYVNAFIAGLTGGLSLQIEHHLFPQCPLDKLPQLAQITRSAVERHGLEYRSTSFFGGLADIWSQLEVIENVAKRRIVKDAGQGQKNIGESLPLIKSGDANDVYQSCQ